MILLALLLQSAAPACTAEAPPPVGLEAWKTISAMSMGPIGLNATTGLMLQSSDKVAFALPPERAPGAGSFAGVYTFNIATPGTYRIALSAGAWIDVVRDGKSIASAAHTEGPPCSGIRKIVDFTLVPGRYTLQLSGAKSAEMRVLIATK